MLISTTEYLDELRTQSKHIRSGQTLITDAPTDNEGKGEAFSPTDLLSTSLSNCMMTLMGITAKKHGFDFGGATAHTSKEMLSNPRRVGKISVSLELLGEYSDRERRLLETAAINCPVAKSLHPDIAQEVEFHYSNQKTLIKH